MLSDITTAIKAQLYDRVTSPLSGAFIISWIAWNWKFLTVLLSDLKAPAKIAFIQNEIFIDPITVAFYGLLCPLATSMFFITCYPIPARWFYKIAQKHNKKLKEVQQASEDEMPMTLEEATELRRSYRSIQSQHEHDIASKLVEITQLKSKIDELENTVSIINGEKASINTNSEVVRQKSYALESKVSELEKNLTILNALNRSSIPQLFASNSQSEITYRFDTNFESRMTELDTSRTEIDQAIEHYLTIHMRRNGLLQNFTPLIIATNSTIYLQLTSKTRYLFIIGSYIQSSLRPDLNGPQATLDALDRIGVEKVTSKNPLFIAGT